MAFGRNLRYEVVRKNGTVFLSYSNLDDAARLRRDLNKSGTDQIRYTVRDSQLKPGTKYQVIDKDDSIDGLKGEFTTVEAAAAFTDSLRGAEYGRYYINTITVDEPTAEKELIPQPDDANLTLDQMIQNEGLSLIAVPAQPPKGDNGRWYKCKIIQKDAIVKPFGITVGFGSALPEPTVTSVLKIAFLEAEICDQEESFENYCLSFGYEPDSREAFRNWEKLNRQTKDLKRFFAETYTDFAEAVAESER